MANNFYQYFNFRLVPSRYNPPANVPFSISVWVPQIFYNHPTDSYSLWDSGGFSSPSAYVNLTSIPDPVLADTGLTPAYPGGLGELGTEFVVYGTYTGGEIFATLEFRGADTSGDGLGAIPAWGTDPIDIACSVYNFRLSYMLVTSMVQTSSHSRALLNVTAV